jgi:MFS family permease
VTTTETKKNTAPSSLRILSALAIGDAAFGFQQTAVLPATPTIEHALGTSETLSAWLVSGYLIAASIASPLFGKLGDRFGRRRLLLIALVVYMAGAVGAALAPSIGVLIVFRALQGTGGAVFPLSFALTRDELPGDQVQTGIAWLTGAFGVGAAAGFGLSGVLADTIGWRWIFWSGAAMVFGGLSLVRMLVPESDVRARTRTDLPGAALLSAGLVGVLVAMTLGPSTGWLSPPVLGIGLAGLAVLAFWTWRELRVDEPLLDPSVFTRRSLLLANLATATAGFVAFSTYFVVPHLVEGPEGVSAHRAGYGFGADAAQAGLFLLPAAAGLMVMGPLSGLLTRRHGAKQPFLAGTALMAIALGLLAAEHASPAPVYIALAVMGAGWGLTMGSASVLVAGSVPKQATGVSTAFNSVMRLVGGGVGGQVAAAILAAVTIDGTKAASSSAITIVLWTSCALAVAGAVMAGAIPASGLSADE